jgi:hypothetical protein
MLEIRRNQVTVQLFLLLLMLAACTPTGSTTSAVATKFGMAWNPERKRVLLPVVESTWSCTEYSAGGETNLKWLARKMGLPRAPLHVGKMLALRGGTPETESDTYASGRTFPNPDPDQHEDMAESVEITYSFTDAAAGKPPWSCIHRSASGSEQLSLADAERLIASWGLKRL